ncbi:MAG: Uma2 family endonuclease, partial [Acidobacteria bacterium]|nr:Uma2 family endonuclease [Acidobacteriota bacterium]
VNEYLQTSFEGPDRDYLDGEVVERNMGELPHSLVQTELIYFFRQIATQLKLQIRAEIRIQISPTRYRVADIAVWRSGKIGKQVPTVPPLLIVEVLSPEDRLIRVQPKVQEYLSIGVQRVWLVDPDKKQATEYSQNYPDGMRVSSLRTEEPAMEIRLEAVWRTLDESAA